jgi:hypothetical protein
MPADRIAELERRLAEAEAQLAEEREKRQRAVEALRACLDCLLVIRTQFGLKRMYNPNAKESCTVGWWVDSAKDKALPVLSEAAQEGKP